MKKPDNQNIEKSTIEQLRVIRDKISSETQNILPHQGLQYGTLMLAE
jgi:hypothetical protein